MLSAEEAKEALAWTGPISGFLNMHYPRWFKPRTVEHTDGAWESFERSTRLTRDGRVRIVPTPGHTAGHQSVVVEQDDHLVLIAGDASYAEKALLAGEVDGVAASYAAHRESTGRLRALCRRHLIITQFAHDPASRARLEAKACTKAGE